MRFFEAGGNTIGKLSFSRYETYFSVSYEVNERKKLFKHALDRIIIMFSCRP